MPKDKILRMGIMNIKTHPHSVENYKKLMTDAFDLGSLIKIRGADWGTTHFIHEDSEGIIYGEFYRFLQIDANAAWLDLRKRKLIVDEKGNPVPQAAADVKPNSKPVLFYFDPNSHRLFFDIKGITPNLMKVFLERMLNAPKLARKYGEVYVEVESSEEVIEKILKIPTLTKLEIIISRPNDDVYDQAQRFLDKMGDRGIRKYHQIESSTRAEGIQTDEDTVSLMQIARSNGMVYAVGYEGDERVNESTVPHPRIITSQYNEDNITLLRALINEGQRFIDSFRKRRK